MKLLLVGDPHVVVQELEDAQKLIDFVLIKAQELKAKVVFMGDQYDNHSIIHADVQKFWFDALERFTESCIQVFMLKGNHDFSGVSNNKSTALLAHINQCEVILEPQVYGNILFMPYMTSKDEFIDNCVKYADETNLVLCHATINGVAYDNGFYAGEDAIDPNLIPQKQVISGHIHRQQLFGKIQYIGSPRWRNLNDANIEKVIWLIETDDQGTVLNRTPYSTGDVCRQIFHFQDSPDKPLQLTPVPIHEYRIDIKGPEAWIEQRKPLYNGWAKVRTIKTDTAKPKLKESEGIKVAFTKWVNSYQPKYGTDKSELEKMVRDRVSEVQI